MTKLTKSSSKTDSGSPPNNGATWTLADLQNLRSIYSTTSAPELIATFGRSFASIAQKARGMGLQRVDSRHWSAEEVKTLREQYASIGGAGVAELTGRAITAVYKMAQELDVRILQTRTQRTYTQPLRRWTSEEDDFLKAALTTMPRPAIAAQLNRSEAAIGMRVHHLCLAKKDCLSGRRNVPIGTERIYKGRLVRKIAMTGVRRIDWKRVDVIEWEAQNGPIPDGMFLVNPKFPRYGVKRLAKPSDIRMLAAREQMTTEMLSLIKLKSNITREISRLEKLNPDESALYRRKIRFWTSEDDDFLRSNYKHRSNKELGEEFKCSASAVEHRLFRIGLKRDADDFKRIRER